MISISEIEKLKISAPDFFNFSILGIKICFKNREIKLRYQTDFYSKPVPGNKETKKSRNRNFIMQALKRITSEIVVKSYSSSMIAKSFTFTNYSNIIVIIQITIYHQKAILRPHGG